MAGYNLPILLHPRRTNTTADYAGRGDVEVPRLHQLRVALRDLGGDGAARLRRSAREISDAEDRHPSRRRDDSVLPQAGAAVVGLQRDADGLSARRPDADEAPLDYYRMFYCDTAIQGNTPALMCAYEFFGADHMVFATDTPYDNQLGERVTRETIEGVEAMPIDAAAGRRSTPTTRAGCSGCRFDQLIIWLSGYFIWLFGYLGIGRAPAVSGFSRTCPWARRDSRAPLDRAPSSKPESGSRVRPRIPR